jgi:hypothetical protein
MRRRLLRLLLMDEPVQLCQRSTTDPLHVVSDSLAFLVHVAPQMPAAVMLTVSRVSNVIALHNKLTAPLSGINCTCTWLIVQFKHVRRPFVPSVWTALPAQRFFCRSCTNSDNARHGCAHSLKAIFKLNDV